MGSRFAPSEQQMREMVQQANERAERLARRISAARRALLSGQHQSALAILEGRVEA